MSTSTTPTTMHKETINTIVNESMQIINQHAGNVFYGLEENTESEIKKLIERLAFITNQKDNGLIDDDEYELGLKIQKQIFLRYITTHTEIEQSQAQEIINDIMDVALIILIKSFQ